MRRLLVALVAAVALVLPATAALASDGVPAGASACRVIFWHEDNAIGRIEVWLCT